MSQRKTARQTFEAGLIYIRTEYGWKYLAPNGDAIYYHDINILPPSAPPGPIEVHDPVYEPPKHENVTDRLNAVEAQNRDIMRQLVNLRKSDAAQAETIAGMAAKIHALANRCDTIERRAKAAAMGINDAQEAVGKLDTQINGNNHGFGEKRTGLVQRITDVAHKADGAHTRVKALAGCVDVLDKAHAWIDTMSVYKRMQSFESALTGVGGLHHRVVGIEEAINGRDDKGTTGLRSRVGVIQDRVSAVEQATARIEDMLTGPKAETVHPLPEAVVPETVNIPTPCQCQLCRDENSTASSAWGARFALNSRP